MEPRAFGGARRALSSYLGLSLAAFACASALAQTGAAAPSSDSSTDASEELTSNEQGQVPIEDSYSVPNRAARARELRREAFRDTNFYGQLRTFYMDSNNLNGSQNEAWALGGSAGFKTGYFRDFFAFGGTAYTSQRLEGPPDKDGTTLLAPGQHGYSALGEAYGEFVLTPDVTATVGLHRYDTPFLSGNDSRMSPNTFEGAVVLGSLGGDDLPSLRYGAGYVDKIKERNSDTFVSMSKAAGALPGVSRGVAAAGATYVAGDLTVSASRYYSPDILNIFYGEVKDTFALAPHLRLGLGAQYTGQHSAGDDLLLGHSFSAAQFGLKAELSFAGALVTTAYTQAKADGTTIQSPWSANPGYTSVQVENFDRSGEKALLFRAAYKFPLLKNLTTYALYVHGSRPDVPNQYAQNEFDMNLEWKFLAGGLRGLRVLVRYGHVSEEGPSEGHTNQLRLVLYYDLPLPSASAAAARSTCTGCSEIPGTLTASD